ncbi:LacI family DNA-binding transcriptional regulator [Sporolactobacillus kofuensis]|uniref:LacI family DNA-binding transcriptional regulator n=1 Tax=Sporolactobacillus kofuensis TaxID=269672 RepID=A0ABW1WEP8_9BACL|nr:LacI family DNA-binding transcriptional regulator [Sporolactobacillus kofuensis]MCO7175729.1 LacI family transcriptional regulator [Sporolactobacillus kofuensis]
MATIKQVAKLVGVSPTTVSNVIHGRKNKVSPEIYKRVKEALNQTNYVSNMSGRILSQNGSKIIGVILNYSRRSEINVVSDPFYNQMIGYLEEQIRMNEYYMMLYTSGSVQESLNLASAWKIEGLVILGALPEDAEKIIQVAQMPVAFIDTYISDALMKKRFINVGLQDFKGCYEITNYLIDLGHRQIGFCADGNTLKGVDEERYKGFKQAMADAGLKFDEEKDYFGLPYQINERHDYLSKLAKQRFRSYTALVFTSDYLAIDAMNILKDNQYRVPQDLSITGFDHNIFSEQARPKLTTVEQNVHEKAELTIKHLMQEIHEQGTQITNIKLSTKLIIQESTQALKK